MDKSALILSVDGGGIRGLIPASFLSLLEKDLQHSVYDTFDMYAGTSVGSFVVLAISGLQSNMQNVLTLFNEKNAKRIFDKPWLSVFSFVHGTKYKGTGKRQMLQTIFADRQFTDIAKPTLITAYDIIHNSSAVFKSIGGVDVASNPTIAEVADCSSAAPTYFPTVKLNADPARWLVDGGVAANDPSMCILSTAIREGYRPENIKILSLGTGIRNHFVSDPNKYGQASQHWGGLDWLRHGILDDLMAGNSSMTQHHCKTILKQNYYRVNGPLIGASDDLDDISPDNLLALQALGRQWYQQHRSALLQWLSVKIKQAQPQL